MEQLSQGVHVKYKLVAQEEVIDQLKRDRKLLMNAKGALKNRLRADYMHMMGVTEGTT